MTIEYCKLDKSLIKLSGIDTQNFLQGLTTTDVKKQAINSVIYSCMLGNNSRFLYDFFIYKQSDQEFLLEIEKNNVESLMAKLKIYKLRSKVNISLEEDLNVFIFFDQKYSNALEDSRLDKKIYRLTTKEEISDSILKLEPDSYYWDYIIDHYIVEGRNLIKEKSIILDYGFDEIGAIDFNKGCYIGQELITRTKRLGMMRKKLVKLFCKECQIGDEIKDIGGNIIASNSTKDIHLALIRIVSNEGTLLYQPSTKYDIIISNNIEKQGYFIYE